jgi:hypothetical protein
MTKRLSLKEKKTRRIKREDKKWSAALKGK